MKTNTGNKGTSRNLVTGIHAAVMVRVALRHEVTEDSVFAGILLESGNTFSNDAIDAAIDDLLDAGLLESTIIDGRARCAMDRDFGVLPALRRAPVAS